MKLLALEIEGYGVWSGLKLQRMSEGLNVVYGPNEAGKSTLLHFIRSALYGFSPDRRRYLPPLHGGRPGGWLEVSGRRRAVPDRPLPFARRQPAAGRNADHRRRRRPP